MTPERNAEQKKCSASQKAFAEVVIMRRDICIDWAKMKLLAQEEGRIHLHDNVMQERHKTGSKKPRTSLDPTSLSNLLHTTYTILLPSSQKVSAFEAKNWELHDQNTVKCATFKTAKFITVKGSSSWTVVKLRH